MQKLKQTDTSYGTMEFLLLGHHKKRSLEDIWEDIQEWLAAVLEKKCVTTESSPAMKLVGKMNQTSHARRPQRSLAKFKTSSRNQGESKNLLDRTFVKHLQNCLRKEHEEETHKRIQQRQAEELQREKLLILSGQMTVEKTPVELLAHPVFKIALETKKTLELKRILAEEIINRSFRRMNSMMLRKLARENKRRVHKKADLILDISETNRAIRLQKIKEDLDSGNIFTREEYERIWYESPSVKQFKTIETVNEMYKRADILIGRFRRIPSVSLIRQDTIL